MLRRTNYGEADRIIQFLTPGEGKLSAIAKGSRRQRSKLAGGIELFAVCQVVIHQGKSDLGIVTSARLVTFYRHILDDYDRMTFGYEVLKRVSKASELVPEPEWYRLTVMSFEALDNYAIDRRLVELWFYTQHAIIVGHGLNTASNTKGEGLKVDEQYNYDVAENGFVAHASGNYSADHIKLLRLAATHPPLALAHVKGVSTLVDDCLHLAKLINE